MPGDGQLTRERKQIKTGVFALGIVGVLMLPLFGASANAELSNGGFQIRAQSAGDSAISAVHGQKPVVTDPGGPIDPEPTDPLVHNFACGPISVNITKSMIELSNANWDAYTNGNIGAMTPHKDGWVRLADPLDPDTDRLTEATKPAYGIVAHAADGTTNFNVITLSATNCNATDNRHLETLGSLAAYNANKAAGVYAETRVVELNGIRYLERIGLSTADNKPQVTRSNLDGTSIVSSTVPIQITTQTATASDPSIKKFLFNVRKDGIQSWSIGELADGSTIERHNNVTMLPNGAPAVAKFNSNGDFIAYETGSPAAFVPSTLSAWNSAHGTNWNGKAINRSTLQGMGTSFTVTVP